MPAMTELDTKVEEEHVLDQLITDLATPEDDQPINLSPSNDNDTMTDSVTAMSVRTARHTGD